MDGRKMAFLEAVLGSDGAASLKKAADKLGDLEGAIVPRAIMAWLGVIARGDYKGEVPGIADSHLDFSKNEDESYTGSISIGEGIFPFHNATVFQLAAAVAVSLGSGDFGEKASFKNVDLIRLGKSIDLLAKAKYALAKAIPGPAFAPTPHAAPGQAIPPTKQVDKGPKPPPSQMPKRPPTEAKAPKHKVPKAKVRLPKVTRRSFTMSPAAMKHECSECGQTLVKNDKFIGCACFADMARFVSLTKADKQYQISFGKSVDEEAIATILEALGVRYE